MNDLVMAMSASGLVGSNGGGVGGDGTLSLVVEEEDSRGFSFSMFRSGRASWRLDSGLVFGLVFVENKAMLLFDLACWIMDDGDVGTNAAWLEMAAVQQMK